MMHYKSKDMEPHKNGTYYYYAGPKDPKMDRLAEILFEMDEKAVLWYGDPDPVSELGRMQGVFLPVTRALFTKRNKIMNEILPFVLEQDLPLVPILQEKGIERLYGTVFGNLQYLSEADDDLTALSLSEKINRNFITFGEGDDDFITGRIFVSYRKKDRAHIPPLQKAVHDQPMFRDFALWYDEFLIPGEDFNAVIEKEVRDSDLCILLITPHVLEPGNFVLTEEYPLIRRLGKPTVAVEAVPTDRNALKAAFPGLADIISLDDAPGLGAALYANSRGIDFAAFPTDLKHEVLIGMAYLFGNRLERDVPRGVKILAKAAAKGSYGAMEHLCELRRKGTYLKKDPDDALRWAEAMLDLAMKKGWGNYVPEALLRCAEVSDEAGDYARALGYYRIYADSRAEYGSVEGLKDHELSIRTARCALRAGELAAAEALIRTGREQLKTSWIGAERAQYLFRAGEIYLEAGLCSEAKPLLLEARSNLSYLASPTLRRTRARTHLLLGDAELACGNPVSALDHYGKSFWDWENLFSQFSMAEDRVGLSHCCDQCFDVFLEQSNAAVRRRSFREACDLLNRASDIVTRCARLEQNYDRIADMIRCNLLKAALLKPEAARPLITRTLEAADRLTAAEPENESFESLRDRAREMLARLGGE